MKFSKQTSKFLTIHENSRQFSETQKNQNSNIFKFTKTDEYSHKTKKTKLKIKNAK